MKTYLVLTIVFLLSFGGTLLLPVSDLFKGIFATPAVFALLGTLYQLIRDEALHSKNIELQHQQHLFNIGAMSHMANVVFDKHVQFCERYMEEVHRTFSTLFREGPTAQTLEHAANFVGIRQDFVAWITDDISEKLFPFEQALRELGAAKGFVTSTAGEPGYEEQRQAAIKRAWDKFNEILTIQGEQPDEHVAIEAVKKKIREILDIEDLIWLRKGLVAQARTSLGTHNQRMQFAQQAAPDRPSAGR